MSDSAMTVRVVPELDEEAFRDAVLKVIAGHAVVKPGETLVVRCEGWNPDQAEMYQEYLDHRDLPFRVLVVIGDELAVASPEPGASLDVKIAGIVPGEVDKALRRRMSEVGNYARSRPPRSA